jgi:hypothetical protein
MMMITKHLKSFTMIVSCTLLSLLCNSCGFFLAEIDDEEITELHQDMKATTRTTIFTDSLNKLGVLLNAYYVPSTPVQSKNIGNKTAEKNLPTELYAMTAAAINKIGRPIVFVPYDAKYVMSEAVTGGKISRLYPKVVLAGGITGFDKDMFEKEREVEASGGWAGAQGGGHMKASANYSRITFDLNAMDYKTQSYFPQVIASNSIVLIKDSFGWGIYGYYMGNGASFDSDLKRKQGIHAALRNLVEFSILEVIGKCFNVPYWRTIEGALPDTEMIARITKDFSEKNKEQQALIIKKLLFLHGFNGLDRSNYIFKSNEDEALKTAMRQYQAANMDELYTQLWLNVPTIKAAKRVSIDRRRSANIARQQASNRQAAEKKRNDQQKVQKEKQRKKIKLKVLNYKSYIAKADQFYKVKEYAQAVNNYTEARRLFGGEKYPAKMITEINSIRSQQQAETEKYTNAVKEADRLYQEAAENRFNYKKHKQAREKYEEILALSPKNRYIQGQIKKINLKMNKYNTVLQDKGEW